MSRLGNWAVALAVIVRLGVLRSHGLEVSALRQTGAYGLSRNPQLVAFLVAMVGHLVVWPSWCSLGVLAVIAALAHLMVRSEEEHLGAVFSAEYDRYCERVPRYLGSRRHQSCRGRF